MTIPAALTATVLVLSLTACTGSANPAHSPTATSDEAYIRQRIHELAPGYPEVEILGLASNPGRSAYCGYLSNPGHEPLVFQALRRDDRWAVSMAPLIEIADWERPAARRLSETNARICRQLGVPLVALNMAPNIDDIDDEAPPGGS